MAEPITPQRLNPAQLEALMNELYVLGSKVEPTAEDNARLAEIQQQMDQAFSMLGEVPVWENGQIVYKDWNEMVANMIQGLDEAQQKGEALSASQISALFKTDADGNFLGYNPATGEGNMGYQDIAKKVEQQYLTPATGAIQDSQQETRNLLQGYGTQGRQDIRDKYATAMKDAELKLNQRGLGNATVQQSINAGLQRQGQAEENRFNEALVGMQAGLTSQFGSQYAQAMQQAGQTLGSIYGAGAAQLGELQVSYPTIGTEASLLGQIGSGGSVLAPLPVNEPQITF